jgi:hypothetical protein
VSDGTTLFFPWKQDRLVVAGSVENVDDFDGIVGDTIEDEVIAMGQTTYSISLVARNQRKRARRCDDRGTSRFQFGNKCQGALRILVRDPITDAPEVFPRRVGENEPH